eukprot:m.324894 g.324894  ORF g.324894 m.324894 type:complete len:114 (+) comp16465_c0_seq22:3593-3934(+)
MNWINRDGVLQQFTGFVYVHIGINGSFEYALQSHVSANWVLEPTGMMSLSSISSPESESLSYNDSVWLIFFSSASIIILAVAAAAADSTANLAFSFAVLIRLARACSIASEYI